MKVSLGQRVIKKAFITTFSTVLLISTYAVSAAASNAVYDAYVGTYNPHGEGVYALKITATTATARKELVSEIPNSAQLIVDKKRQVLYVASEVDNYKGSKQGSITAYTIQKNGGLKLINEVSSEGAGPVYLSIHPAGNYLFIANYISGSIAAFPLDSAGKIGKATSVQQSSGEPGAAYPVAAAPGSFAISDHNGPHAHMIDIDPSGQYVFSTDLGLDRIYQWKFDQTTGVLVANDPPFIESSSKGSGPRHFVFHPSIDAIYLINEESSTVTTYDFGRRSGRLTERSSISSLPVGYRGTSFASGIVVSEDGRNLYVANRLHNSISQFSVDIKGDITLIDNIWTRGDYPRSMVISPDNQYMYVMNQRSDNIMQFAIDKTNGKLSFANGYIDIGSPSQMVFK